MLRIVKDDNENKRATFYAFGAIFLWATQALVLADRLPHLNIHIFLALSFFISALLLSLRTLPQLINCLKTKSFNYGLREVKCLFKKPYIWVGIGGYFLYHYLLFRAIDIGPVVTANLLNFLWPLFFVLLSEKFFCIVPSEGIEKHLLHTKLIIGFSGCLLLLIPIGLKETSLKTLLTTFEGPLIGLFAAIVWAVFTLVLKTTQTKTNKKRISISWAIFPIGATLISSFSLLIISIFSKKVSIVNTMEWQSAFGPALYFGLGPLGIAMIFYDKAVDQAKAEKLGRLSFLTPLLSTLLLLLFAKTEKLNIWAYLGVFFIILVNMSLRDNWMSFVFIAKNLSKARFFSRHKGKYKRRKPLFLIASRAKKIYCEMKNCSLRLDNVGPNGKWNGTDNVIVKSCINSKLNGNGNANRDETKNVSSEYLANYIQSHPKIGWLINELLIPKNSEEESNKADA